MKLNDWNGPEALHAWVNEALDNARGLGDDEIRVMRAYGHSMVDSGNLRGNISEAWRVMVPRINMAMLDLYL